MALVLARDTELCQHVLEGGARRRVCGVFDCAADSLLERESQR